jgi:RNA polymerase sigma-70 factor (ECF subfamily)
MAFAMETVDHTFLLKTDFNNFYRMHYASFCQFANRYVNDPLLAEDIVGDVAVKIWESKDKLRNPSAIKSYFYISVRNACLSNLKDKKKKLLREAQYKVTIDTQQPSLIESIIRTETLAELEAAVNSLPSQCRKVFIKHFFQEKSFSEIASEMNLSISTIKNQRLRGIKLLREKLMPFAAIALLLFLH